MADLQRDRGLSGAHAWQGGLPDASPHPRQRACHLRLTGCGMQAPAHSAWRSRPRKHAGLPSWVEHLPWVLRQPWASSTTAVHGNAS